MTTNPRIAEAIDTARAAHRNRRLEAALAELRASHLAALARLAPVAGYHDLPTVVEEALHDAVAGLEQGLERASKAEKED